MSICQRVSYADIEGLRVGRYGQKVNTSCILYRIGDTIIDTGPANMWRSVRNFLQERAVEKILVTHHHEDHSGNLARINKMWNPNIFAHKQGLDLLAHSFKIPLYRRLVWGRPRLKVSAHELPSTVEISRVFQLKALHTPGHSKDMTCFLEPNRGWVFSGDLYVAASPKYANQVEDPNQEIDSLRHLLMHDFKTVFCAHRGVLENGRKALSRKLNYLLAMREQVRHYRKVGYSIHEIRKRIMGKEAFLYYFSLGEYAKTNLIRAFANYKPRIGPGIALEEDTGPENHELS